MRGKDDWELFSELKFEKCFEWFCNGAGFVDSAAEKHMRDIFVPNFVKMFTAEASMNNFEGKELNIVQEAIWTEKEGFLLVNAEKLGEYAREFAVITEESIDKAIIKLRTETCDALGITGEKYRDRGGWCKVDVD